MQENAVKQRVRMLEGLWEEQTRMPDNGDARVCCLLGTGMVDYRMIKGFVMVQMSHESNLPDVFMCSHFPFQPDGNYGQRLIEGTRQYLEAWNNDALSNTHGKVDWQLSAFNEDTDTDAGYFVAHVNSLAEALEIEANEEFLVFALLPEPNYSPVDFAGWLAAIITKGLSNKVRLLVFDLYESKIFGKLEKEFKRDFIRLYPDLDMAGAMSQIAEQAEATAVNPVEKAMAAFQKNLLLLNKAIGTGDEKGVQMNRQECLSLAVKNNWLHMEALVHFFTHGFYIGAAKYPEAEAEINKAVLRNDEAIEAGLVTDKSMEVQYRISRANMYLLQKKYELAEINYQECIDRYKNSNDVQVLMGIYQMLGMCQYKLGKKQDARSSFSAGWLLVKDNADFLTNNGMAQFYAREMLRAGMDRKPEYADWFPDLEDRWGRNWQTKLPSGRRGMRKQEENALQAIIPEALID